MKHSTYKMVSRIDTMQELLDLDNKLVRDKVIAKTHILSPY
jgi:hypothetical protein